MEDSMWGAIGASSIETPNAILQHQADIFNSNMEHLGLMCYLNISTNVNQSTEMPWSAHDAIDDPSDDDSKNKTTIKMLINARDLNNYTIAVARVDYLMTGIYPCKLESLLTDVSTECQDSKSFMEALRKILSSKQVSDVISALLTQVLEKRAIMQSK